MRRIFLCLKFLSLDGGEKIIESTLYEVLGQDEQDQIFGMFDVLESRPFRIRSVSIANETPSQRSEKISNIFANKSIKEHLKKKSRPSSVSDLAKINLNGLKRKEEPESTKTATVIEDEGQHLLRKANEAENSGLGFVSGRGIKCPRMDFFKTIGGGSDSKKRLRKYRFEDLSDSVSDRVASYGHVESKLAPYLCKNRTRKPMKLKLINMRRAKSAIDDHRYTARSYLYYAGTDQKSRLDFNSHLKLSRQLEARMREERDPTFYGELTTENIGVHTGGNPKLGLYHKFYNVNEWMKRLNRDECMHFYANPFLLDKNTFTQKDERKEVDHENEEVLSLIEAGENKKLQQQQPFPIRIFSTKKFQIDPFENRKHCPIKARLFSSRSGAAFERTEKQTFVARKDYSQMLSVGKSFIMYDGGLMTAATSTTASGGKEVKKSVFTDKEAFAAAAAAAQRTSREYKGMSENLRKQRSINDLTLTRMELDYFILK